MTSPARAPRPTPRRAEPAIGGRRRDHLRVVPPPGPPEPRPRTGRRLFTAVVVVFGSLLVAAIAHGMLASGQAHLNQLEGEIRSEQTAVAQERAALADLRAPGRIAQEAQRIGMVPADGQVWLSPADETGPVVTGSTADPADPDDPADPADADAGVGVEPDGDELAAPVAGGDAE